MTDTVIREGMPLSAELITEIQKRTIEVFVERVEELAQAELKASGKLTYKFLYQLLEEVRGKQTTDHVPKARARVPYMYQRRTQITKRIMDAGLENRVEGMERNSTIYLDPKPMNVSSQNLQRFVREYGLQLRRLFKTRIRSDGTLRVTRQE